MGMRSQIIRVYKVVHTWTGILSGMALFIAFYAGAITIFKEPLSRWATPPTVGVSGGAPIELSETPALIVRALEHYPQAAREFTVRLDPVEHDVAAPVQRLEWTVFEDGEEEHDLFAGTRMVAALAEDGRLQTRVAKRTHLADFVDVLHRVVGLPVDHDATRLFMGVIAALYFVAIVSGLIVLLPSLLKDLFAFRVGPNLKRMWLDAHNLVGLGSLPFHLVMALTAATFAFHEGIYAVQNQLVHDGKLSAAFGGGPDKGDAKPRDPAEMLPPEAIVERVLQIEPDFEPSALHYLGITGPRAVVRVVGWHPRGIHFRTLGGFAMVDPYSGRVLTTEYLPGHQSVAGTVLSSLFALHFGTYGGVWVKWMYCWLGFLGAWLFYSGNLLWIETRRRKAKQHIHAGAVPRQPTSTHWMAAVTVGICLGAASGISLTIASTKWLHSHVESLDGWYPAVYYTVFSACLGWSVIRGGARASVDLLRVAAVAAFMIPTTTVVGALFPALGPWANPALETLSVDGGAGALGCAFLVMAQGAARRVHHGSADSVWSASAPSPLSLLKSVPPAAGKPQQDTELQV